VDAARARSPSRRPVLQAVPSRAAARNGQTKASACHSSGAALAFTA
jgi:hypothetical protein